MSASSSLDIFISCSVAALISWPRDAREQFGTAEPRHSEIGEHARDVGIGLDELEGLEAARCEQHGATCTQHATECIQVRPIVIHADDDRLATLVRDRCFQLRYCQ